MMSSKKYKITKQVQSSEFYERTHIYITNKKHKFKLAILYDEDRDTVPHLHIYEDNKLVLIFDYCHTNWSWILLNEKKDIISKDNNIKKDMINFLKKYTGLYSLLGVFKLSQTPDFYTFTNLTKI